MSATAPRPFETRRSEGRPGARAKTIRILLAEDDDAMRQLLAMTLTRRGYEVFECADGMCLADRIGSSVILGEVEAYDLVVSDIRLPGVSGMEILEGIWDLPASPPLLLITAFGDEATHAEAARLGAAGLLDKPFEMDAFLAVVDLILSGAEST